MHIHADQHPCSSACCYYIPVAGSGTSVTLNNYILITFMDTF